MSELENIHHILYEVMEGEQLSEIQKEFILEDFPVGRLMMIGTNCVFEVIENDGNALKLKPIGLRIQMKTIKNYENMTETFRYIDGDKIVENNN